MQPFLKALNEAGFRVFRESWSQRIDTYLDRDLNVFDRSAFPRPESQLAVQEGWVVAFLSGSASRNLRELEMAGVLGAMFVPVALDKFALMRPELSNLPYFDATLDLITAPQRLVDELLSRHVP